MRIETALYSSREGLQANGQAISVIGDNISNSNTTGYKASRIEFGDLLSEGVDGRQSTTLSNVGSGVEVSDVRPIFDNGVVEFTGRPLDVAIDGNGFLMTGSASDPLYTRAGNLVIDGNGLLATADGQPVLGFQGSGTSLGNIDMRNFSTSNTPTTKVSVIGNLDTVEQVKTAPSNPATFSALGQGSSYINNTTVYDSQGVSHDVTLSFTKTGVNTWVAQAYMDGGDVGKTAGTPVQVGSNVTLNFDATGTIPDANKASAVITGSPAYSDGAAAGNFTIDLGSFTQLGSQSQVMSVTKDGQGAGQVQSYEFAKDGTISAHLSSGSIVTVGKLQLANFNNLDGLTRAGNGAYRATSLAGTPITGGPGEKGLGGVQGGSLERSTVDIANSFVDLVTYQRGYQANSQILNTTNQAIRDTLNLIR